MTITEEYGGLTGFDGFCVFSGDDIHFFLFEQIGIQYDLPISFPVGGRNSGGYGLLKSRIVS